MTGRLRALPGHWFEILGGTVFWCLLWGGISPSDVLGGLVATSLVVLVFPLPRVARELTLRPVAFVVLGVRFLVDLVVSALQVAWFALRPAGAPPSSIIAVRLRSRSDLFLTATAVLSSLIPGSVVVEAQRSTGTLFLHVLGARTPADVEVARRRTLEQEERVLRALARREELEEAGLA